MFPLMLMDAFIMRFCILEIIFVTTNVIVDFRLVNKLLVENVYQFSENYLFWKFRLKMVSVELKSIFHQGRKQ